MDEAITQKDSSQSNPNTDNFFKACETAIRQYRELMESLQVECVQSWKKILDSTWRLSINSRYCLIAVSHALKKLSVFGLD